MFNGQSASVFSGEQRPFVTSIIPVVGDFAAAQQPVITILPEGTQLNVRAVASSDRRFVKMTLVPFFSRISSVEPSSSAASVAFVAVAALLSRTFWTPSLVVLQVTLWAGTNWR